MSVTASPSVCPRGSRTTSGRASGPRWTSGGPPTPSTPPGRARKGACSHERRDASGLVQLARRRRGRPGILLSGVGAGPVVRGGRHRGRGRSCRRRLAPDAAGAGPPVLHGRRAPSHRRRTGPGRRARRGLRTFRQLGGRLGRPSSKLDEGRPCAGGSKLEPNISQSDRHATQDTKSQRRSCGARRARTPPPWTPSSTTSAPNAQHSSRLSAWT